MTYLVYFTMNENQAQAKCKPLSKHILDGSDSSMYFFDEMFENPRKCVLLARVPPSLQSYDICRLTREYKNGHGAHIVGWLLKDKLIT